MDMLYQGYGTGFLGAPSEGYLLWPRALWSAADTEHLGRSHPWERAWLSVGSTLLLLHTDLYRQCFF